MDIFIITLIVILSLLLFILIFILLIGRITFSMSFKRKKGHSVVPSDINIKLDKDWFNSVSKKKVSTKSFDGLTLTGYLIIKDTSSKKFLICSHGYQGRSIELSYFAHKMYDLGYNLLLIDLRGCGDSQGKFLSMGYYESYDLAKWVNFLKDKFNDAIISLYGWSMGAATSMMSLRHLNSSNIKAIVEDCGYDTIYNQLKYVAKSFKHIFGSEIILWCFNFYCKIFNGINIKDGPINYIENSDIPILFIHGGKDDFVPTYMSENLFKKRKYNEKDKFRIFDGSKHAMSLSDYSDEYIKIVDDFLKEKME